MRLELSDSETSLAAWRITADSLPSMLFSARPDASIEFVNRRWLDFTGYEPNSAANDGWRSLIHPDDVERFIKMWQDSQDTGNDLSVELQMRKTDGTYSWVLISAAPLRDRAAKVIRWYGDVVDIDFQKLVAKALREREAMLKDSERRFLALAEAIPVICWTADASGWIDWYNHRWHEYTGQTLEEAAGWGWQSAHHPDDFLEVMRKWPHSIATGEPFEMDFRIRRRDGVFRWFLTRAEPLRDETGKVVRWYGSQVDIDAQKQSLERMKRLAEAVQDIFLPKMLPQRPNLRLDAVYFASDRDASIGGDWFDAFELPDGRLAFSIGDVAGHGLEASMVVGRVRQAIFTMAFRGDDSIAILKETNRILNHQEPGIVVTALVGFVNQTHTVMRYASAGHPPPLIAYRNDELAVALPCGGLPLGVDFELDLVEHIVPIHRDAVVALYTDGITEFSRDLIATEDKLRTAVALLVGDVTIARPALAIKEIVFNDSPTTDDAALLIMQFSSGATQTLRSDSRAREKTWRFHSSDAYSAHAARKEIIAYLHGNAADPDQVFTGELILGEILANTVKHAPGLVEIRIDWLTEKPVLTVRDTGPGLASFSRDLPKNALDDHGRGIFLIKALAEEASATTSPGQGTELRAILPILRRTTSSAPKSEAPPN